MEQLYTEMGTQTLVCKQMYAWGMSRRQKIVYQILQKDAQ